MRKRYALAACAFVAENFRREHIWEELRKEYERMLTENLSLQEAKSFLPQRHRDTENSQR